MAGTAAWVDILPNLSGFGSKLTAGVTAASGKAGQSAGKAFSRFMALGAGPNPLAGQIKELEGAEKKASVTVSQCTAQIAKARDAQKAAALRAQAAELKLNDAVVKYGASSAQALSAQARLTDARSKAAQRDDALKNAEDQLRAASDGLKETQSQLAAAQDRASKSSTGFPGVLNRFVSSATAARAASKGLSDSQSAVESSSGRLSSRFGMLAGAVGGVASSIVTTAVDKFMELGSSMAGASDSAQKFASTMSFAGIDDKTIQRLTKSTQDYADKTVFDLSDIRNTTAQLAANGVDNYAKLAEAAGNLTAVAGGGADAYKSVAMALTQTAGAGKLTTENWNQIADAIPGASGKLQKAMKDNGAYTGDFRDAMANGEITADEFNQALMQLGMDDVAKKAASSTSTFEGAMGNWQAALQKLGATALDKVKPQLTGALDFMSDKVTKFTDWTSKAWDGLANNKSVAKFFNDASGLASSAFDTAKAKAAEFYNSFKDTASFQAAVKAFDTVTDAAGRVARGIGAALEKFGGLAGMSGDASAFGKIVGDAFNGAAKFVDGAADALGRLGDWTSQHSGAVATAIGSVGGAFAAFKAYSLISTATNALKGFTLAQLAANVALKDNPIGLAVSAIGALVSAAAIFFTQTETGRSIVAAAWSGIQSAVGAVTSWFQSYVVPAFQTVWGLLKTGFQIVGQVFSTVWNAIKTAFQVGFLFISTVVITPFKLAFDALGAAFDWLYANVFKPTWNAIVGVFGSAWSWIDQNVIQPFEMAFDVLGAAFDWLYSNVVQPVWNAISNAFSTAWNFIKATVIDAWNREINGWAVIFNWLSANVVQPVWNAISNAFSTAWNWISQNVITPFKNGIQSLGDKFMQMKDVATKAWDSLKEAAASPVRFVVNTVYTNGIQKVWNGIADAVGLKNLRLPDANVKFATGGVMPGYTPGRDTTMIAVGGGEAIMRPEFTRAVGKQQIYEWNRLARTGGSRAVLDSMAGVPHYANGGVVPASQAIANANRATAGWAGMCLKFVKDMYHAAARFPSAIAAWNGSSMKHPTSNPNAIPAGAPVYFAPHGNPWGHVALSLGNGMMRTTSGDGRIHTDPIAQWVKWGCRLLGWTGDIEGQPISGIGSAAGGSGLPDKFADFLSGPAEWVKSRILDPVGNMVGNIGGGNWGAMMGQLPVNLAKGLVDKAVDAAKNLVGAGEHTSAVAAGGSGVERWRGLVNQALTMLGQPTSWADTVLRRMNQESGGNPNAINNWDSNARAGHPSQGLMQTIPSTFDTYAGPFRSRGILDPLANIYAGLNYALHRYGSLSALNRAGGYAFGGIVPERPTLYDRGGVLPPGRTLVANDTKRPELILNPDQIRTLLAGGAREMNLNVSIPERSDPWSDADIWVRTARQEFNR